MLLLFTKAISNDHKFSNFSYILSIKSDLALIPPPIKIFSGFKIKVKLKIPNDKFSKNLSTSFLA